jgi:hypothetical protein
MDPPGARTCEASAEVSREFQEGRSRREASRHREATYLNQRLNCCCLLRRWERRQDEYTRDDVRLLREVCRRSFNGLR